MHNNFIVLIPPLLVLILAFLTQKIISSLIIGIISASLIVSNFAIIPALKNTFFTILKTTQIKNVTNLNQFINSDGLLLFIFLLILGAIITLLTYTGGASAYRNFISKKIKNKTAAEESSLILSLFFFLDDYFGCVTVGSIMHPLTDKFKIARTKLAFLVNSMAPTLVIIVPISSWSAAIVMNITNSGVSDIIKKNTLIFADPFFLYLTSIPFIFYSFIMIISTWFITIKNISFGLMKKQENIAEKTGNLFGGKKPILQKIKIGNNKNQTLFDFLFPLSFLILSIFILILYTGNFTLLDGNNSFIHAIQQSKPVFALMLGSLLTFLISVVFFMIKKVITISNVFQFILTGIKLLGPSIILLILAWSLTDILNYQLLTGQYLARLFIKYISIQYLPLLFFIITSITAVAIGSAWGSMAIMIPIAIQMLVSVAATQTPISLATIPIIYPLLGAIMSGAVTGNHLSPTSDTMVMAARSSGAYHMDHVRTEHTYSIPAYISTALAFLIAGQLIINYNIYVSLIIGLLSGISLNIVILLIRNYFQNNNI